MATAIDVHVHTAAVGVDRTDAIVEVLEIVACSMAHFDGVLFTSEVGVLVIGDHSRLAQLSANDQNNEVANSFGGR